MGGLPVAINGTHLARRRNRGEGKRGSRGGGGVAAPFHYGGGGTTAGRRAMRRELWPVGGGGMALPYEEEDPVGRLGPEWPNGSKDWAKIINGLQKFF
jgi:hypothetical protein